eukprot:GFUD01103534.1.p1 GENE.GFUD01103534.1~~GFUD01103534.1.p1  ORF type:complete len:146 (+),score=48.95 GFUD01103534.1:48-440(+)
MYLLDSLGGSQEDAREAMLFGNFLLGRRKREGSGFVTILTDVLQQPNYTDCAFFVAKTAQKILQEPDMFLALANEEATLTSWYEVEEVRRMRGDIATLVLELAVEQRQEGGTMEALELDIPEIDFTKVRF